MEKAEMEAKQKAERDKLEVELQEIERFIIV
jgi:hypothetical protein